MTADEAMRLDILSDLRASDKLCPYRIEVAVEDATIVLTGEVETWDEVVAAGYLAARRRGVRNVVNELTAKRVPRPGAAAASPWPAEGPPLPGWTDHADVVIIGGGVIGTAIARELSRYQLEIVLLERSADVAAGASKANNGMVHPGVDPEPGSLKATLNVRGNALFGAVCADLDVPFVRSGLCGVTLTDQDAALLPLLRARAEANGVPGVEVLDRQETLRRVPGLTLRVTGAFWAPTTAMTSPYQLTVAYAENAVANGVRLFLETAAVGLDIVGGRVAAVRTNRGPIAARWVINAAGVYADEVSAMTGHKEFTIHPRRGVLMVFDRQATDPGPSIGHFGLGMPEHSKGGGAMVTVDGNLELGPDAEELPGRDDVAVTAEGLRFVIAKWSGILPGFPLDSVIAYFAGLRAATYTEDFHVALSRKVGRLIHVAGIQSPGLASAPAVAEMVTGLLRSDGLSLIERHDWQPVRRAPPRVAGLAPEALAELVAKDPAHGRLVCRCERVSEAEIKRAIGGPVPAGTIDAIKRRTRAGMGRCQGAFCGPRVAAILSGELRRPITELTKDGPGSWLFAGRTKAQGDLNSTTQ
ncbi:MAG TPA: FAD-dependent oxidoreductase [Bacillota bacterium]|jgi:glycerol-3-phosphate dehydrogenase